jgi:hypothetical protein
LLTKGGKIMRPILISLLLAFLLMLTCTNEKSSGPSGDKYELITSESIGSEGGSLGSADFSVEIPEGALEQSTEVKLYVSEDARPFAELGVSSTFKLEGLPEDFDDSLHIIVKHDGTLNEESFIAFGEEIYIPEEGDTQIVYSVIEATDSSGYLVADLRLEAGDASAFKKINKSGTGGTLVLYLLGISDEQTYQSANFKIRYPRILRDNAIALHGFLEDALFQVELMNFGILESDETLPIIVLVREEESGYFATYIPRPKFRYFTTNKKTSIAVREQEMGSANYPAMRVDVGFEMYRWMAATHNRVATEKQPLGWFDYAVAYWSCKYYASNPAAYVPSQYLLNSTAVLDSFDIENYESDGEHRDHGKCMSAFIKYLVDNFGKDVIKNIYDERIEHNCQTYKTIFDSYVSYRINIPHSEWYPEFIKQLINEEIYADNGIISARLLDKKFHSYEIDSDDHQTGAIPGKYKDLQTRIVCFQLTNPNFEEGDQLILSIASEDLSLEDMHLIVFKRKGYDIEYIGDGASVAVNDILALKQSGYDIYGVVVNCGVDLTSDDRESDINLVFEVVEASEFNVYRAVISLHIDAMFHDSDGSEYMWEDLWLTWEAEGSTIGNIFEGDIDQFEMGYYPTGTMTTIDDELYGYEHWDVGGNSLQATDEGTFISCSIEGMGVCDVIIGLNFRWERDEVWNEVLYPECGIANTLYITLYIED